MGDLCERGSSLQNAWPGFVLQSNDHMQQRSLMNDPETENVFPVKQNSITLAECEPLGRPVTAGSLKIAARITAGS